MSRPVELESMLGVAHALADAAAQAILPHFRSQLTADHKGGKFFDPVTEADRAAEKVMRAMLADSFPDHGIVGEEFGSERADADYCWSLDPIDGTRSFIMGQPLFGTLIGLTFQRKPVLGIMDQPFTGERFWSGGEKSWLSHRDTRRELKTRQGIRLSEALLATTSPDMFADGEETTRFEAVGSAVRLRRFGGDCYNYCLLALGLIDLVVEAGLKPFDIIALIPIIENAGGVVTTWDGGAPSGGGRIIAAGNAALHAEALKILAG